MLERFEHDFAAYLGVDDAVAVSSGTAGLHLGVRGMGWGRGRRGPDLAVLVRGLGELPRSTRASKPVFCDVDPVTLNLDPDAAGDRRRRGTAGHPAGRHPRLSGRDAALEEIAGESGLGILEDACEALGAVDADGGKVGARGITAVFAFYANKQLTTGEGGMVVPADAEAAAAPAQRAQPGPCARTWAGSTTTGSASTTASPTCRPRSASRSSSAPTRCSPPGPRPRRSTRSASASPAARPPARATRTGSSFRAATEDAERRSWFVYAVRLPRGGRPRRGRRRPRPARGGGQGLHALHPPARALSRALRAPGRRVPGGRGRLRSACWRCRSSRA